MNPEPTILIVEDEEKIAALLRDYLTQSGFQVRWVGRGDEAEAVFQACNPDLILLDLMLPGLDGLAVCKAIRAVSEVPIIMLTAKVDEIDRLLGLELGADDYICKPFSLREVVARVKAVLRRFGTGAVTQAHPGLKVDEDRFVASINGTPLDLTPVEFRLLALLASQPGRVFSRAQLMDRIYLDGRVVSDRTVDSHIKNLRQKIHEVAVDDDVIRSIYGVGYKLD